MSLRKKYLDNVIEFVRSLSGCQCAGIRILNEEGGIPYESYSGFSREFWESENCLSVKKDQCACIRIITGQPEPQDLNAMTQGGSFLCNNLGNFVNCLTEQEKTRFRGMCAQHGYASVAVIPVRYKNKIIGAIHLADKGADRISPKAIESIESLTRVIGDGLQKFDMEDTIRLAEMELMQAQKDLESARRLSDIGTLASVIAHELRNPLSAIRIAAYNIKRKGQLTSLEKHFATIEKKIVESDQIINNLLFYSRLKMPHYQTFRVYEILNECIASAKKRFSEETISVDKKIDSIKKDYIEADPLQIGELFNNILNNAFEALSNRKGKIAIAAGKDGKDNIEIIFRDNGVGIEDEDLKRIFEPFFTKKSKGTGLGLTVCNQVVNLHSGKIEIESKKDRGTTFTVILPMKKKKVEKL